METDVDMNIGGPVRPIEPEIRLDNPGFFTIGGRVSVPGAVVDGWAPEEDGPIIIIERPQNLSDVQQRPLFFSGHYWFCCQCAAQDQWSACWQSRNSLQYGECTACKHQACPDCALGPSPNPVHLRHTLSGMNISKERLIGVTWACSKDVCREFARNRLDDTPPPTGGIVIHYPDRPNSSGDFSETPAWHIYCRGNMCRRRGYHYTDFDQKGHLSPNSLVLSSDGRILGSWDGTKAVDGGPWMQHLRALQQGHTVLRQFLEITGRREPEILHASVGMRDPDQ